MVLWERSATLAYLDDLLGEAASEGRIVLVTGEAGIGKSTLVGEFARRSRGRAYLLWGACDRLTTPRALGPLQDIGHQTGGALAERLSAGAAQDKIFAAFLGELSGPGGWRHRPLVVVEDAHWADEATLDWLAFVGRRINRISAMLIMTYRDDEVGKNHPLRGVLACLPAAVVRRVPLRPLSPDCVAGQARLTGRDPAELYRLTGGNPLLVTELLKSEIGEPPAAVQDLILDRIRALPAPARDLAEMVAVVPTRADAGLVAGVPDLVELCVDAGVLVASRDGVAYRHELLRSAVEESLLPARRAALHRGVLSTLTGIDGVDPGRLAHHARAAADADAVLHFGQVAGAAAARAGAHREAASHYAAAATHAGRLPLDERADLLEAFSRELYVAGRVTDALGARRSALAIRERLGDPQPIAENLSAMSRLLWVTGHRTDAWEAAERAVRLLEQEPPNAALARAHSHVAQLYMVGWRFDDAIAAAARASELARQAGDEATHVHALINASAARLLQGDLTGQAGLLAAHRQADAIGLMDEAARALINLCGVLADELVGYVTTAPIADRTVAYAEMHDLDGYTAIARTFRAGIRFNRGDWDGALADADVGIRAKRSGSSTIALAYAVRGRIEAARGSDEARTTLDEAARLAEEYGEPQHLIPVMAARSEYFHLRKDLKAARAEARRGLRATRDLPALFPYRLGEFAYRLWRTGADDPPPPDIAEPYRLMIDGDWAAAAAAWDRRGAVYLRAEALALGDETAANEALTILDRLGAAQVAANLRGELRRRGVRNVRRGPRSATRANAACLTSRQVDVLALLAQGLSNSDIAAHLTLSTRTVDHHVAAILDKLDAGNRAQAVSAAHRLGLLSV
jgi:DNA-binding CsgD family transcriptional regulator